MAPILAFLSGLISPITEIVKGWQERKRVKLENELAVATAAANAKIERLKTTLEGDIAWENTALVNAGMKDEVMMAVILTPMVLCFFPGGADLVRAGFLAMKESLPAYWEWAFMATVGVSYGLRKWTDLKSITNGASVLRDCLTSTDKEEDKP